MDFTQFDIKVLVVSTFALLLISATAGATPIGGDFGEAPRFNQTASLDLSVPNQPGPDVSTEGELRTGPDIPGHEQERYIIRSDNLEVSVIATGYNPPNSTSVNVVLEYVNTTNASNPQTILTNEILNVTEGTELVANNVAVLFEYTENNSDYATIQWDVRNYPDVSQEGSGGGGLWAALNNIGEWIGYAAQLLGFFADAVFAAIVFVFTMVIDIVSYIVGLIAWITGGYGSIIGSAPTWASPFIAIPALALGFELMKLIIIVIDVLWIG